MAHFAQQYRVLALDLPGHGRSDAMDVWSADGYAGAIAAVVRHSAARDVVLVAHSMAGAYALLAAAAVPQVRALVVVDTLKDLDRLMSYEQAEAAVLNSYRADFPGAVRTMLPIYLYAPETPEHVRNRLQDEFLRAAPAHAVNVIEPLYKMDIRDAARRVPVPVRAINGTLGATNVEANRRYLADYGMAEMPGTGHYPMLERPEEFNRLLASVLESLPSSAGGGKRTHAKP